MNELIPLMVIVPLMAALIISAFSRFNKVTKIFAFVVAICLPLIPYCPIMACITLEDMSLFWIM